MKLARIAWIKVIRGEVIVLPAVATGLIVTAIALLVGSKRGDIRVDVAMASMAAFLFGVLLAFTIVRTRERLVLVQDLVAKSDAALLTVNDAVAVFDGAERDQIRELVDRHLIDQIDYRLVDYHRASPSFRALIQAVLALRPASSKEDAVYKELVARCFVLDNDRALIEAATGQEMSPLEWMGLLLLFFVLVGLLAVLPGGTPLGSLVAGVMAGTLVTLLILLRKLDLLRWHEQVTIWEPTTRLFRSMGRDPYVPRDVIDQGRYRPSGRVRVVDYPDPYPIRASKVVTVVDLGGAGPIGSVNGEALHEVVTVIDLGGAGPIGSVNGELPNEEDRPLPPPGWYPDPENTGFMRAWNGVAWIEQWMAQPTAVKGE